MYILTIGLWCLYAYILSELIYKYRFEIKKHWLGYHTIKNTSTKELLNLTVQLVSFTHSTICVLYSSIILAIIYISGGNMYSIGKINNFDYLLGVFSLGYFVTDSVLCVLRKTNILFLYHHIICCIIFYTIVSYGLGRSELVLGLFIGEITNPIQKIWEVLKSSKSKYFYYVNFIYTPFYVIIRGIAMPIIIMNIQKEILYGVDSEHIPIGCKILWTIGNTLIQFGSFLWSYKTFKGFYKYLHTYERPHSNLQ